MTLNLGQIVGPKVLPPGWRDQEVQGLVRQIAHTDCGVACLAMAANITYNRAQQIFCDAGLSVKRAQKKPWSSNFRELQIAIELTGAKTRRKLFRDWSCIQQPAILKVNTRKNGDWHWVYAGRNAEHGLFVLDPSCDLPSYEKMPMDMMCRQFAAFKPAGHMIEVVSSDSIESSSHTRK